MVRNISKGTTQIVKIHIGDKGKKEEPKKKRKYTRKPKKPSGGGGGGYHSAPWVGEPLLQQAPVPAPYARQGWTLEPLQIKRAEEPKIERIEHNPQMNIIYPPREIRSYVAQMLEQANAPRVEEVEEPKQRRIEAPAQIQPIEEPSQPMIEALPVAEEQPNVVESPIRMRTAQEIQELRQSGLIDRDFLNRFNVKKKTREGDMTLLQVASKLGIPVGRTLQNSKDLLINHILANM